jgi:hypothetical protein
MIEPMTQGGRASLAALLAAAWLLAGCAGASKKDAGAEAAKRQESAATLRRAFDAGRSIAPADPAFVAQLQDGTLAYLLQRGPAPYAGARRLLDLEEHLPGHPLVGILLPPADAAGARFHLQDEEAFRSGLYFNSYDPALFGPFFRTLLLDYLKRPAVDEAEFLKTYKALELSLRFTPRWAGVYPNQLAPETQQAMRAFSKEQPDSPVADRLEMLRLWDERNGAWAGGRAKADAQMKALRDRTKDELLKLELKDALAAPVGRPERAFWMSFLVPGLGQVSQGDIQGGILLGGLTASAWVWMASKLAVAHNAGDDDTRQTAYGDAAWAGGLALLGHTFTGMNAAENVRFMNIVLEWDILSRPRAE